jgi:hypothetical protein
VGRTQNSAAAGNEAPADWCADRPILRPDLTVSSHLTRGLPRGLFPRIPQANFFASSTCISSLTFRTLADFIALIILGEYFKFWNFLCVSSPFCVYFPHSSFILTICIYHLYGLVVRVPGYRHRGPGFDSRHYKKVVGLERSPLSLVSTIEELLGRNSSGSGLEIWEYGHRESSRWPRGTLYRQNLALTSLTNGGLSVGIVRLRTEAIEFFFLSAYSCDVGRLLWTCVNLQVSWNEGMSWLVL